MISDDDQSYFFIFDLSSFQSVGSPGQEIPSLFDRSPYGEHLLGIGSQLGYGPLPQISGSAAAPQTGGSPQCAPQPYGAIGMPRVSDLTGNHEESRFRRCEGGSVGSSEGWLFRCCRNRALVYSLLGDASCLKCWLLLRD